MNNDIKMKILELEWPMFHNVNGEERASCQNDQKNFIGMRGAQYDAWSDATGESYLCDLKKATEEGRNLPKDKYIHMMKSTDPEGYEHFKSLLPAVSEEKEKLVCDIWAILLVQTEAMRKKYPLIALGGRPLHAYEEFGGATSIETYQKGELYTYSEKTLTSLLADIKAMQADGKDYAYVVQENTILAAGYPSMEKAEEMMLDAATKRYEKMMRTMGGGCPNCN